MASSPIKPGFQFLNNPRTSERVIVRAVRYGKDPETGVHHTYMDVQRMSGKSEIQLTLFPDIDTVRMY